MRVMSTVSLLFGLGLTLVGIGGACWAAWVSYRQWLALDALRSLEVDTAGLPLLIGSAGLLFGGFFIGLALGRPRKDEAADVPVKAPPA